MVSHLSDKDFELRDEALDVLALDEFYTILRVPKELKTQLLVSQLCVIGGRLGMLAEFALRPRWKEEIRAIIERVS